MAANPQMVIRVAATVAELKKNLAEGKANIEALSASVAKYAKDWTAHSVKLQQDARNVVAAIDRIGASTLTAGDASKALRTLDAAMAQLRIASQPIPPLIQETADKLRALHPAATAGGTALSKLVDVAGSLGLVFSVGSVVAFGKALLDDADALVKLSDKTGIALEPLQRLKYIAEQSGNTLDDVTSAVSMFQKRVAGGDDSAEQALRDLGIAVDQFRLMSPDQQFMAIAVEVAKIEDPMLRVKAATDLFGRSGAEILPTLIADVKKLGDEAPVMSAKAKLAFDTIGDTAGRVWTIVKNKVGEGLVTAFDSYARLAKIASRAWRMEFMGAAKAALDLDETGTPETPARPGALPMMPTGVALSMDEAAEAAKTLTDAVKKAADEAKKLSDQMDVMSGKSLVADVNALVATYERLAASGLRPTHDEQRKLNVAIAAASAAARENGLAIPAAWSAVTLAAKGMTAQVGAYAAAVPAAVDQSAEIADAMSVLESRTLATGQSFDEAKEALRRMANLMPEVKDQTDDINAALDQLAQEHAEKVKKALGNVCDALDGFSRVAEMAGHKTTAALASVASTTIKAFASGGPVAGAIALVTGLFTALGDKLFKTAQKALNDTRDLFITSRGGFDALNAAAAKAGAQSSFLALLQAKNTKTYEAALTKLNTILQKTSDLEAARIAAVPVWETVSALAEKYGISVESAGQAVQQLMINANAKTMINDWETWAKAGGNMDAMAAGMATSMSTLVQQAALYGTTLPQNLRPVLDFLAGAGTLVDAAGNAIDVSALTFGPEVQTEMERLAKSIDDLVAELRVLNGLPAVSAGLSGLVAEQNTRLAASGRAMDYGGAQAAGGDYWVTKPTLFLAGERGSERATFSPSGGGSAQTYHIHVNADGRELTDLIVRHLGGRLSVVGGRGR